VDEPDPEHWKKSTQKHIQLKVCNVLRYWLENYWQDFNHELTQMVVYFVDNLPQEQKNLVGKQINKAVLQRVRKTLLMCFLFLIDLRNENKRKSIYSYKILP
jgi:hypothetical protein